MADALLASTLEPVAVIGRGEAQVIGRTVCPSPVIVRLLNTGADVVVRPDDLVHESSIDRAELERLEAWARRVALEGRPCPPMLHRSKVEAGALARGYEQGRRQRLDRGRS